MFSRKVVSESELLLLWVDELEVVSALRLFRDCWQGPNHCTTKM